jgi:hypothetical protein
VPAQPVVDWDELLVALVGEVVEVPLVIACAVEEMVWFIVAGVEEADSGEASKHRKYILYLELHESH